MITKRAIIVVLDGISQYFYQTYHVSLPLIKYQINDDHQKIYLKYEIFYNSMLLQWKQLDPCYALFIQRIILRSEKRKHKIFFCIYCSTDSSYGPQGGGRGKIWKYRYLWIAFPILIIMSEGREKDCVLISPRGPDRHAKKNEARYKPKMH